MARVLEGFYSFTCTPRVHPLTEWTIPAFAFPAETGTHLPTSRVSWPLVTGWLHTERNVRHRELNPDTVAHLSNNRARRGLTSLTEANALTIYARPPGVTSRQCERCPFTILSLIPGNSTGKKNIIMVPMTGACLTSISASGQRCWREWCLVSEPHQSTRRLVSVSAVRTIRFCCRFSMHSTV